MSSSDFKSTFTSSTQSFKVDTSGLNDAVGNAFDAIDDATRNLEKALDIQEEEREEFENVAKKVDDEFAQHSEPLDPENFNSIINELITGDDDQDATEEQTEKLKAIVIAHVLSDMGLDASQLSSLDSMTEVQQEEFAQKFKTFLAQIMVAYNGDDETLSFSEFTDSLLEAYETPEVPPIVDDEEDVV